MRAARGSRIPAVGRVWKSLRRRAQMLSYFASAVRPGLRVAAIAHVAQRDDDRFARTQRATVARSCIAYREPSTERAAPSKTAPWRRTRSTGDRPGAGHGGRPADERLGSQPRQPRRGYSMTPLAASTARAVGRIAERPRTSRRARPPTGRSGRGRSGGAAVIDLVGACRPLHSRPRPRSSAKRNAARRSKRMPHRVSSAPATDRLPRVNNWRATSLLARLVQSSSGGVHVPARIWATAFAGSGPRSALPRNVGVRVEIVVARRIRR